VPERWNTFFLSIPDLMTSHCSSEPLQTKNMKNSPCGALLKLLGIRMLCSIAVCSILPVWVGTERNHDGLSAIHLAG